MAIEDLEEALVDIGAAVYDSRLKKGDYDEGDSSTNSWYFYPQKKPKSKYEEYEAYLLKAREAGGENKKQDTIVNVSKARSLSLTRKLSLPWIFGEIPSITLNDMLEDENDKADLMEEAVIEMELMEKITRQSQQMKDIFDILDSFKCRRDCGKVESDESVQKKSDLIKKAVKQLKKTKEIFDVLCSLKCQTDCEGDALKQIDLIEKTIRHFKQTKEVFDKLCDFKYKGDGEDITQRDMEYIKNSIKQLQQIKELFVMLCSFK